MPKKEQKIDSDDEKIVDFIYAVMEKRLNNLSASFNSWMSKIGFLIAFVGVVTFYYLGHFTREGFLSNQNHWHIFIKCLTLVSLSGSMLSLLIAAKNRNFFDAPQPKILYSQEKLHLGSVKLKNQMVANMVKCYYENKSPLDQIAIWVSTSWYFLTVGLIGVLVSVLI